MKNPQKLNKPKILIALSILVAILLMVIFVNQMYVHSVNETRVECSVDRIESKNSILVDFFIYNHEGRDLNYTFYFYINGDIERTETVYVLNNE